MYNGWYTYHGTSNEEDDDTHEAHHEVDVGLVLGILLLGLGLLSSKLALDTELSLLGLLGGEDGLDELFNLEGSKVSIHDPQCFMVIVNLLGHTQC